MVLKYKFSILNIYKQFLLDFKKLEKALKLILILITLSIIAQCSTAPFVIDNESYYIQTIKWINEYGFVKKVTITLFLPLVPQRSPNGPTSIAPQQALPPLNPFLSA